MKYKIYERLTDFFHSSLFSKTNIAIVAVMSIVLNIALGGIAYSSRKDLEEFMYATTSGEEITTAPAGETATALAENFRREKAAAQAQEDTSASEAADSETQQATYYVTSSGTKYHKSTCSYLSKSRIAISLGEAKAKGYTPCSRCIG